MIGLTRALLAIESGTPNDFLERIFLWRSFKELRDKEPFPFSSSKKGLQIQMADDALALGVKHALSCHLTSFIEPTNQPGAGFIHWNAGPAKRSAFIQGGSNRSTIRSKLFSDAGVVVR